MESHHGLRDQNGRKVYNFGKWITHLINFPTLHKERENLLVNATPSLLTSTRSCLCMPALALLNCLVKT